MLVFPRWVVARTSCSSLFPEFHQVLNHSLHTSAELPKYCYFQDRVMVPLHEPSTLVEINLLVLHVLRFLYLRCCFTESEVLQTSTTFSTFLHWKSIGGYLFSEKAPHLGQRSFRRQKGTTTKYEFESYYCT